MTRCTRHTCELAYSNSPPMGANIIPMAKNRGSTVLGVRIGLVLVSILSARPPSQTTHCHAFSRCCLKAVSMMEQPCQRVRCACLPPAPAQPICQGHLLAGLLLFFFSGGFESESWEAIEPFRSPPGGESFPRAIVEDAMACRDVDREMSCRSRGRSQRLKC